MVPVVEPGRDPADVIALPPPAVLAAAASALQVEAARWARLRVGEELVYEWPPANPASVRALRAVPRQRDGGPAHAGSTAAEERATMTRALVPGRLAGNVSGHE